MSKINQKARIKELQRISELLKPEMYQYKISIMMLGRDMILTGLPLPVGCRSVGDVKKDDKYHVTYSGFRDTNHFKRLKGVTKGIKDPREWLDAVVGYCEPFVQGEIKINYGL